MLICSNCTFGQIPKYYSKLLFENNEIKYKFVNYKSIPEFANVDNKELIDFFKVKKANKIKIYFLKRNESFFSIIGKDTVYNGIRIIDIFFSENDYRSLLSTRDNLKNDIYNRDRIFSYFKASKIVCFNDSKSFIRIIVTKGCSEYPSFIKFKKALKANNVFNCVVFSECGVYNLEIITKR